MPGEVCLDRADVVIDGMWELGNKATCLAGLPSRRMFDFSELDLSEPSRIYSDPSTVFVSEIGRNLIPRGTACLQSRADLIEVCDALLDGEGVPFHFVR